MTNQYYEEAFTGVKRARARVAQIIASLTRIQSGFGKLPNPSDLWGNSVNYTVLTGSRGVYSGTLDTKAFTDASNLQLRAGMRMTVKMPERCPGACTLDLNGTGAKPIRVPGGETAGGTDPEPDYFQTGDHLSLIYSDQGTGHWNVGIGGAGPVGSPGLWGVPYNFSTTTTPGDPGDGHVRFNHATPASVTKVYIDDEDDAGNDISSWIATFDDAGSAANRGFLVFSRPHIDRTVIFKVTAVTDRAGYTELDVTHVSGDSLPGTEHVVGVQFLAVGPEFSTPAFSALAFASTLAWDVAAKPKVTVAVTDDIDDITISNAVSGHAYVMVLIQDSTGGHTWDPPSSWKWSNGGTVPQLSSAADAEDILTLLRQGNTTYASLVQDWQ